jgi:hypothetical protein
VQRESVKASAFCRAGGRRGRRRLQWLVMKAPITRSEEGGGVYDQLKAHDRVKEGGAFITVLHGAGEGRRGANGATARAEVAALPAHCGRKEKGAGSACRAARGRVGWLSLPGHSGAGGLAWPLCRLARKLKKIPFPIKIEFFNLPRLWKFIEGDLGGILRWVFFLNSSRLLKDFRKNIICHALQCTLYKIYF